MRAALAKKLIIAVDLDGIVADLHHEWLRLYNEEHNHGTQLHDLKSWDMHHNVEIGHKIYNYLADPGLYLRLKPLAGAVEALADFHEFGHDVQIITAASKTPQSAADKYTWCKQHLPFLDRKQITISHQKHRFVSDVFIDDSPVNMRDHAKAQPGTIRMGIAWPYNEAAKEVMHVRAESYRDPLGAWAIMYEAVNRLANGESL